MDLINKDFVTAAERVNSKLSIYNLIKCYLRKRKPKKEEKKLTITIQQASPVHLARIYMQAEKKALNAMGAISKKKVDEYELQLGITAALCRQVATLSTTSIVL